MSRWILPRPIWTSRYVFLMARESMKVFDLERRSSSQSKRRAADRNTRSTGQGARQTTAWRSCGVPMLALLSKRLLTVLAVPACHCCLPQKTLRKGAFGKEVNAANLDGPNGLLAPCPRGGQET